MLGLCCHFLGSKTKRDGSIEHFNRMDERLLQLGRYRSGKYTSEVIKATYVNNVRNLAAMLPVIRSTGVRHFRMSSSLFPLADQVDRALWDNDDVKSHLRAAGDYAKANGMRITTHPGQFCVLSSDSDRVVANSFAELAVHGWAFDSMGLEQSPKWSINIHGGKADRSSRLIEQIKSLPDPVRKRLTLENDETAYSVTDLLRVHDATGIPVVMDTHHHVFNDGGLDMADAIDLSMETWPKGIKPLQHLSNTEPSRARGSFADRRKHSNMVHYIPERQLQLLRDDGVDVEIEAKMKNLAISDMAAKFSIPL
jgi:UV DNA damage endonuclease